jgi:chromosome segregation protein
VLDLFLGTGLGLNSYAIVEQGKVETFLHMKPHERRLLIEEASGITRFETKKAEAYQRMEETRANLQRLNDLCAEIRRSWEKARIEWERWKRYRQLTERIEELEHLILLEGLRRIEGRKKKIEEELHEIERAMNAKNEERALIEGERGAAARDFSLIDGSLRRIEIEIKEKEKAEETLLVETRFLEEEKRRLLTSLSSLEKEVFEIGRKKGELGQRIEDLKARTDLEDLEAEEEMSLKREAHLLSLKATLAEKEQILEAERTRLFVATGELLEAKNRLVEAQRRLAETRARLEKKEKELERIRTSKKALDEKRDTLLIHMDSVKERLHALSLEEAELSRKRQDLLTTIEERKGTLRRLTGERRGKEEYLRMLTRGLHERMDGEGTLLERISVPAGKEEMVDRLFSRELEYFVCYEEDPISIATFARQRGGGVVFFREGGVFERRADGVSLQLREEESIEAALSRIGAGEEGFFFAEGLPIDSRGIIHRKREEGPLRRRLEIATAQKELRDLDSRILSEESLLAHVEKELQAVETSLQKVKAEISWLSVDRGRNEKELVRLETELKALQDRYETLAEDDASYNVLDTPLEELETIKRAKEREKEAIEGRFNMTRKEVEELKKSYERLSFEFQKATFELQRKRASLESNLEELERSLKGIEALEEEERLKRGELEETQRRLKEQEKKREEIGRTLEAIKLEKDRLASLFQDLSERLAELKERMGVLEERLAKVREEQETLTRKRADLERDLLLLEEKAATIRERFEGRQFTQKLELSLARLEREREELLREREALGEINFRAEKEYKDLGERLSFLENEKADLEVSLEGLRKTIRRIEGYSREVFMSTFHAVGEAFRAFAERLFEGGIGELRLNEETGGVDMLIRPRGKRVVRVESLSGGEKALASLSFLLSLMETRPAPFCIFDEIDAPLDDANVLRLREILKEMAKKTQLVLITHNRLTIEICDVIYGITIERDGISRIVPARI